MTINIGTKPINLKTHPKQRYVFQLNITKDLTERRKQLGHYRHLKDSLRKQILERDNHTCQICGSYGNKVDHIKPWRISRDNSPENLRVLCHKCNTATRLPRRDARPSLEEWFKLIEAEANNICLT